MGRWWSSIPVPFTSKHGNYASDVSDFNNEDSNDEDSNDDALQEVAIQMDLEGCNAVADEFEINEQPSSET